MRDLQPRSLGAWALIAVVIGYALVLLIAPLAAVVVGAFSRGVEPLIRAVTAPQAVTALRLSVTIAVLAAILNTVFGVLIAWVLVRHRFPGRTIANALVDLPFVVSPVIIGFVVIVLFGRGGWLEGFPIPLTFNVNGMLLVTVFVSLPFVIREVMPVLAAMTPEQEEAAMLLGAGRWTSFRRIVFPSIRHAVIFGVVLTGARALGEFGAALGVGGGIQGVTETATIYVYRTLQDRNPIGAYGMALTLGAIAVGILTVMNVTRRDKHH